MINTTQHTAQAIDELAGFDRWLLWREEPGPTGKLTKVPYKAVPSRRMWKAKSTDSTTWVPYEKAVQCCDDRFDGISVVLGDLGDGRHLCGMDLDSCLDDDGVADWAVRLLDLMSNTYMEVSPSGRGTKAFFYVASDDIAEALRLFGVQPGAHGRKVSIGDDGRVHGPGVEFYTGRRFFTVTGHHFTHADQIATFDLDGLRQIADLLPKAGEAATGGASSGTRDTSRSAKANQLGRRLKQRGAGFDEFGAALRADPVTKSWYAEKGQLRGERELHRIWDKAPEPRTYRWQRQDQSHDAADDLLWQPASQFLPLGERGMLDEARLPKRDWLLELLSPKGKVSVLVAEGGSGKSTIAMAMSMSVLMNEPLLGLTVYGEGGSVAYCLLEDDIHDLLNSLVACGKHHRMPMPYVMRNFYIYANDQRHSRRLVIAERDPETGAVTVTPVVDRLVAALIRDQIELLVVDPYRYTHTLAENANDDMAEVMLLWNEVARRARCVVLLVHHFNKGSGDGVGRSRGAIAITDHSRAALPMSPMTKSEAEQFDHLPDNHASYVRLDNPKLNYQKRPKHATWFHLVDVELANGEHVGAAERWYPSAPKPEPEVPLSDELKAPIERGPSEGEFYTKDSKSKTRWFGSVVMQHMNVDASNATKLIAQWLKRGVLVEADYTSPSRRGRQKCLRLAAPSQPFVACADDEDATET